MKKMILFLIILFINSSFASDVDSLKKELNIANPDTSKCRIYLELSTELTNKDSKKAIEFAESGLKLSQKLESVIWIARFYNSIAFNYMRMANADKALEYYTLSENSFKETNSNEIARVYSNRSAVYTQMKDNAKALEEIDKSLSIAERDSLFEVIAINHTRLGDIYKESDYEKALNHFEVARVNFEKANNKKQAALQLTYIAAMYWFLDDKAKADSTFQVSINELEAMEAHHVLGNAYMNYSSFLSGYNNQHEKALGMLNKALILHKEANHTRAYVSNLYYIQQAYLLHGFWDSTLSKKEKLVNYDSSIYYGLLTLELADSSGMIDYKVSALQRLSEAYEVSEKNVKALEYYKYYKTIYDSVYSRKRMDEFKEQEKKLELRVKDAEIESEKTKSKLKDTYILWLISGALLIILLGVAIMRRNQIRRNLILEKKQHLEDILSEKDKALKDYANSLMEQNKMLDKLQNDLLLAKEKQDVSNKNLDEIIDQLSNPKEEGVSLKEFELKFIEIYPEFYSNVSSDYDDITPTELRVLSFLKLNFSTQEIADLTNTSYKSVEKHRYSIRKKMGLERNDNLSEAIQKF